KTDTTRRATNRPASGGQAACAFEREACRHEFRRAGTRRRTQAHAVRPMSVWLARSSDEPPEARERHPDPVSQEVHGSSYGVLFMRCQRRRLPEAGWDRPATILLSATCRCGECCRL